MDKVTISGKHDFDKYQRLVEVAPEGTIYHTKSYVEFLSQWLSSEAVFLGIKENDCLLGAISFVIKKTSEGTIINSNPYYGSYGGFIIDPKSTPKEKNQIRRDLIEYFHEFANENDCTLSTLVLSPFERYQPQYTNKIDFDYSDYRVGQISALPQSPKNLRDALFYNRFSSSSRRAVRKAEKVDISIELDQKPTKNLDKFYEVYAGNMHAKEYKDKSVRAGGKIKDKSFFEGLMENLPMGAARLRSMIDSDGELIGGIFELVNKDTIDYYQPAIKHEARNTGATNLAVFEGMKEGIKNGFRFWNFGGTWETQEGVYRFKRGFGTTDYPYKYLITAHGDDEHIKELTPEDLQKKFPGFYVLPYSELNSENYGL